MGEVNGRVTVDGQPRSGVAVSDGGTVVVTDSDGCYALTPDADARFLWITTPGDAWAEPFYQPLPTDGESVDFGLTSRDFTQHRVAYVTDMHLERAKQGAAELMARDIDRLNAADPPLDVVLFGGDICVQSGQADVYAGLCERLRPPARHTMGNHDFMAREPDPSARFETQFGPRHYSFRLGQVHYVALCGQVPHPEFTDYRDIWGWVDDRELAWLAADLAARPEPGPVVVFSHIAFQTTYGPRRHTTNADNPWWNIGNADAVIPLLAKHGAVLVCQGHLHENETIVRDGIQFVSSVSIGGMWWIADPTGDIRNVAGEPRGWRVIEGDRSTVTHRFVAADPRHLRQVGEAMERDGQIWYNLFDGRPGQVVEVDSGDGWRTVEEELYPGGLQGGEFDWQHCFRLGPAGEPVAVRVDGETVWTADAVKES